MSFEKELKTTMSDVGHKIVKTALASVPVAGTALSELFTTIVAEPSSRRRDKILILIDERLNEIAAKVDGFDINNLAANPIFLSTVSQAYQIAMRTHQDEKIESLLNSITNSALRSIEDNLQHMFLMFIDSFTEWHLKLLILLDNPSHELQSRGLRTDFGMGSISQVLLTVYPDLRDRDEFTRQLMKDLYNRGLVNTSDDGLKTMMTGSGMVASRTSQLGKQFIEFIKKPF
jgi:hypothetical protein